MAADPFTSRTADELLQYHAAFDTDDEDLAERPPLAAERDDKAILSPRKRKAVDDLGDGLVEEEVKITKQRKKIPKLDTDKLLSEPGIPKIRGLLRSGELKKKLRFKGKGHEFSDTARLLNYYQMWLDNLYPRAKFADAVQLVEKAGHTKKMQMYRKSWIDEGKPGHVRREEVEEALENQDQITTETRSDQNKSTSRDLNLDADEDPASMFFADDDNVPEQIENEERDGPDDDELDALLAQEPGRPTTSAPKPVQDDSEGEDDLDAILAQSYSRKDTKPRDNSNHDVTKTTTEAHPDADKQRNEVNVDPDKAISKLDHKNADANANELDTLLAQNEEQSAKQDIEPANEFDDDDFPDDDMDELDTLLNSKSTNTEPELPSNIRNDTVPHADSDNPPNSEEIPELDNVISSSPIPNVHTDELDQLMDEHDATVALQKKQADPEILEEFMSSSPIQSGG